MAFLALLASGLLLGSTAHAASVTRGPYLQLLTSRSVTIVWRTDRAARCALAIRPAGGQPAIIGGSTGTTCAIGVSGLLPGWSYVYMPLAGDEVVGPGAMFWTDGPTGRFRFAVVGDTGDGGAHQLGVAARIDKAAPHFVLHTGDMIYESGASADFDRKFFTPYRKLLRRMVIWPLLGNHDWRTSDGQPWRDAFFTPANNPASKENYYSFRYGNALFVVLNSNGTVTPGSPQYQFLDRELATPGVRWRFVAFHHTIYSSGEHGSNTSIRANLVPLFDRRRVDVVFMGHDHDYERTLPLRGDRVGATGTVYVTTGGGGKELRPVGDSAFTAYSEAAYHFTQIDIDNGDLFGRMVREDGRVRDVFALRK
jgi:hypothetical protein